VIDRVLQPKVISDTEFEDIANVSRLEKMGVVVSCLTNSDNNGTSFASCFV